MFRRVSARWLATAAMAAIAAGTTFPAGAGLFDDDEARVRIEKLRSDLAEQSNRLETRLEATIATTSRSQIELANQIERLKADMANVRGQIEVLTYELEATQKRQKDFYIDLDNRIRKIETAAAEVKPAAAAPGDGVPPDPAAEMRDYETALTLFKSAKYNEALAAFLGFIKNRGNSNLLANAHYWAASAHFQLREYPRAAELFAKVASAWPGDSKAPDAMLGQANSQQEAGDVKGAKKTREQLIEKYPASNAAQTAKQQLKKK